MLIYYDVCIRDAQVKKRLKKLSFRHVVVFVVGCVTHARDFIVACQPKPATALFVKSTRLLNRFWKEYPESLRPEAAATLDERAMQLLPDDDERVSRWENALVTGIAHAFCLAKMRRYTGDAEGVAISGIDRAYIAVYSFMHEQDRTYPTEEAMYQVEINSPACNAEIEFQLTFLHAIEGIRGKPPGYSTILRQMKGKPK